MKTTRLTCHRFRASEVRLWLSAMTYNLGNRGSSREDRGRLDKHLRYHWLMPTHSRLTRRRSGAMPLPTE